MRLKSNKSFSLLEVIITVAILSTAIVFVLRAFTTVLASVRFSQNITLACLLAENKLWELEEEQKEKFAPLESASGIEKIQNQDFKWSYKAEKVGDYDLIDLRLTVAWKEKAREQDYTIEIPTYLLSKIQ